MRLALLVFLFIFATTTVKAQLNTFAPDRASIDYYDPLWEHNYERKFLRSTLVVEADWWKNNRVIITKIYSCNAHQQVGDTISIDYLFPPDASHRKGIFFLSQYRYSDFKEPYPGFKDPHYQSIGQYGDTEFCITIRGGIYWYDSSGCYKYSGEGCRSWTIPFYTDSTQRQRVQIEDIRSRISKITPYYNVYMQKLKITDNSIRAAMLCPYLFPSFTPAGPYADLFAERTLHSYFDWNWSEQIHHYEKAFSRYLKKSKPDDDLIYPLAVLYQADSAISDAMVDQLQELLSYTAQKNHLRIILALYIRIVMDPDQHRNQKPLSVLRTILISGNKEDQRTVALLLASRQDKKDYELIRDILLREDTFLRKKEQLIHLRMLDKEEGEKYILKEMEKYPKNSKEWESLDLIINGYEF